MRPALIRDTQDERSGTEPVRSADRVDRPKASWYPVREAGRYVKVGHAGIWQLRPIEDIGELHAHVYVDAFVHAEVTAEVRALRGSSETPEGTNRALIGGPLGVWHAGPRL